MIPVIPVDSLFWGTGALVWAFICLVIALYVVPAVPALFVLIVAYPFQAVGTRLDSVFYDGPEDVRAAQENGAWYFYLIRYLLLVGKGGMSMVMDWFDVMEPYYRRLPRV